MCIIFDTLEGPTGLTLHMRPSVPVLPPQIPKLAALGELPAKGPPLKPLKAKSGNPWQGEKDPRSSRLCSRHFMPECDQLNFP